VLNKALTRVFVEGFIQKNSVEIVKQKRALI